MTCVNTPANNPQAAARVIVLTVVADGDVSTAEFALREQLGAHDQLGLERDALHEVFDHFCEDLLSNNQLACAGACPLDEYTLAELMGDIDAPQLRRRVLDLCVKIAELDGHVAECESIVLVAAVEHWGLQREMLRH